MGMREAGKAKCRDCGVDVSQNALIVSTVVGKVVTEALCCTTNAACFDGFLDRASRVFHAPIEIYGGGNAAVFVDDNHFTKISPSFGPVYV